MPVEKGTTIVARPGDPKYEASREKGFRSRWLVAEDYEIRNRMLLPVHPSQLRESYPANDPGIPIQLAKIKEGDEKALLAFARKYGSLGFMNVLPYWVSSMRAKQVLPGDLDSLERLRAQCGLPDRELWKDWIAIGGEGDPLPWIWAHVRTLRCCLDLSRFIEDEDEKGLLSFFRQYQWRDSKGSRELHAVLEVAFEHEIASFSVTFPPESVLWIAKWLRRELINRNIQGIRVALTPEGDAEKSYFGFQSLIEMAYWHLHNRAIDGMLKRCKREGCGNFFIQTHRGTEFCPEPKTPKGESRCAVLDRTKRAMKKYRAKLRRKRKPNH